MSVGLPVVLGEDEDVLETLGDTGEGVVELVTEEDTEAVSVTLAETLEEPVMLDETLDEGVTDGLSVLEGVEDPVTLLELVGEDEAVLETLGDTGEGELELVTVEVTEGLGDTLKVEEGVPEMLGETGEAELELVTEEDTDAVPVTLDETLLEGVEELDTLPEDVIEEDTLGVALEVALSEAEVEGLTGLGVALALAVLLGVTLEVALGVAEAE